MRFVLLISFALTILLAGCGGPPARDGGESIPTPASTPIVDANWYRPALHVTWQWQLSGAVNTAYDVDIYDIDLFDSPAALIRQLQTKGSKVICYFSAGSYEEWRPDADHFSRDDLGDPLDGWPGERWLDIRSPSVRDIMLSRLDRAQQKGCDGVEPDNVDGYANLTGFALSATDQLAFNRFLAYEAHARGLSIGLKNDLDQIGELVDSFDFAVNEQCFEYAECDALAPFIAQGKAVLHAEYDPELVRNAGARQALCADAVSRHLSTLILPPALDDSLRLDCM